MCKVGICAVPRMSTAAAGSFCGVLYGLYGRYLAVVSIIPYCTLALDAHRILSAKYSLYLCMYCRRCLWVSWYKVDPGWHKFNYEVLLLLLQYAVCIILSYLYSTAHTVDMYGRRSGSHATCPSLWFCDCDPSTPTPPLAPHPRLQHPIAFFLDMLEFGRSSAVATLLHLVLFHAYLSAPVDLLNSLPSG